jgi:hypothetical protein
MARKPGSPLTRRTVTLHVPEDWIFTRKGRQYIFVDLLFKRMSKLSMEVYGTNNLSARFSQLVFRDMLNTVDVYGMRALNVEEPERKGLPVSLDIHIIGGEGEDSVVA